MGGVLCRVEGTAEADVERWLPGASERNLPGMYPTV